MTAQQPRHATNTGFRRVCGCPRRPEGSYGDPGGTWPCRDPERSRGAWWSVVTGEIGHDAGCLAARLREAHCGCSRRDWLTEQVPRYQARMEVFEQISRWAAEKTMLAEGHVTDSTHGLPVFEAEAHKAAARMAAAMYIEFGNTARKYLAECKRVEADPPKQTVVTVELPLFDLAAEQSGGQS